MPSEYNPNLIASMEAKFRRLNNPAHAMADAMSMYQSLPGLVGFWPAAIGTNALPNNLVDYSQSGLHMTRAGSTVENENSTGLNRYVTFDGSTGYHYIADSAFTSFGVTGVAGTTYGFTILAWVRPTGGAGANRVISAKYTASGNQGAFILQRTNTSNALFSLSSNGSTFTTVQSTNTVDNNEWRFLAARWQPSTQLKIWEGRDGLTTDVNTTSIPATIFDSTAPLSIGAANVDATPSNFWFGDVSLLAICRKALADQFVQSIYEMTAPLFGVSV